jgi:hypothetical protein
VREAWQLDSSQLCTVPRKIAASVETGNINTVLSLMADDGNLLRCRAVSRSAKMYSAASEAKNVRLTGASDICEIKVDIEITIRPRAGEAMRRRGCTLLILRKQSDGKWVLWRDANCPQVTSELRRRN